MSSSFETVQGAASTEPVGVREVERSADGGLAVSVGSGLYEFSLA